MKLYDCYKDKIDMAFGKNIKYIVCGGAPLSKEIRKVFKEKNLCLMQTYALTEVSSSFTLAYPYHDDLESAGEIYEDIDVRIADKDNNGIGEITVKGDNVFKGYINEELNKQVFDKDGYFHTGDLGYIKNKKLYVVGRKKKILVTSNGENVLAESIENNISNRDNNIRKVNAYIKDDKIVVDIYITSDIDGEKIIEEYNKEVPKYERVSSYNLKKYSLETRLKQ
jgi:long-subunit acyl-CoA synthetase (AMP-forming)